MVDIGLTTTHNNHFTALCPGLPRRAGIRRNSQPPTILIIIYSHTTAMQPPSPNQCSCGGQNPN